VENVKGRRKILAKRQICIHVLRVNRQILDRKKSDIEEGRREIPE
jgi:hypothetical protein